MYSLRGEAAWSHFTPNGLTVKDRTTFAQCVFSYILFLFFSAANYLCVASLQCNGLLPMVGSPEPKNTLVCFVASSFCFMKYKLVIKMYKYAAVTLQIHNLHGKNWIR